MPGQKLTQSCGNVGEDGTERVSKFSSGYFQKMSALAENRIQLCSKQIEKLVGCHKAHMDLNVQG